MATYTKWQRMQITRSVESNNSGWDDQGDLFGLAGQNIFLDDLELGLFSEIIKIWLMVELTEVLTQRNRKARWDNNKIIMNVPKCLRNGV